MEMIWETLLRIAPPQAVEWDIRSYFMQRSSVPGENVRTYSIGPLRILVPTNGIRQWDRVFPQSHIMAATEGVSHPVLFASRTLIVCETDPERNYISGEKFVKLLNGEDTAARNAFYPIDLFRVLTIQLAALHQNGIILNSFPARAFEINASYFDRPMATINKTGRVTSLVSTLTLNDIRISRYTDAGFSSTRERTRRKQDPAILDMGHNAKQRALGETQWYHNFGTDINDVMMPRAHQIGRRALLPYINEARATSQNDGLHDVVRIGYLRILTLRDDDAFLLQPPLIHKDPHRHSTDYFLTIAYGPTYTISLVYPNPSQQLINLLNDPGAPLPPAPAADTGDEYAFLFPYIHRPETVNAVAASHSSTSATSENAQGGSSTEEWQPATSENAQGGSSTEEWQPATSVNAIGGSSTYRFEDDERGGSSTDSAEEWHGTSSAKRPKHPRDTGATDRPPLQEPGYRQTIEAIGAWEDRKEDKKPALPRQTIEAIGAWEDRKEDKKPALLRQVTGAPATAGLPENTATPWEGSSSRNMGTRRQVTGASATAGLPENTATPWEGSSSRNMGTASNKNKPSSSAKR